MASSENNKGRIPFVGHIRVGNYKVWRTRVRIKTSDTAEKADKKEEMYIPCINISNLECTWKVQIPSTFEMYGLLMGLVEDMSAENKETAQNAKNALLVIFSNMSYATIVGNPYFQKGLRMLASVYAFPSTLDKKDEHHKEFVDEVKSTVKSFLTFVDSLGEDEAAQANFFRQEDALEAVNKILDETADDTDNENKEKKE